MHWIQVSNKRWHAWRSGSHASLCGSVNVAHLRLNPAKRIQITAPLEEVLCSKCSRKAGVCPTSNASPDVLTSAWVGYIRRHLTHVHARVADKVITALASRLAEIGTPADAGALQAYELIKMFLLTPRSKSIQSASSRSGRACIATIPRLKEALAVLPKEHGALLQVAATLCLWQEITGRNLIQERFKPDTVLETIFKIPSPAPYIKHLHSRGFSYLAAVFHPNTLERTKKDTSLRGLFSRNSDYSTDDYWNSTSERRVVTE